MRTLCVLLLMVLAAISMQAQELTVWACDGGTRVMQTQTGHWSRYVYDNSWNGTTVTLSALKNEIVDFQLIISGGITGESLIDVTFDTLSDGAGHYIMNTPGADSMQYVGNNIELFVMHYLHSTAYQSEGASTTAGAEPADSVWNGWIGDALVPIKAPSATYDNGQGGAPFNIAAGKVQSSTGAHITTWPSSVATVRLRVRLVPGAISGLESTFQIDEQFHSALVSKVLGDLHLLHPQPYNAHLSIYREHIANWARGLVEGKKYANIAADELSDYRVRFATYAGE